CKASRRVGSYPAAGVGREAEELVEERSEIRSIVPEVLIRLSKPPQGEAAADHCLVFARDLREKALAKLRTPCKTNDGLRGHIPSVIDVLACHQLRILIPVEQPWPKNILRQSGTKNRIRRCVVIDLPEIEVVPREVPAQPVVDGQAGPH